MHAVQIWSSQGKLYVHYHKIGILQEEQILPRLEHVADAEKVNLTEDGKKALMTLSNGDMRYAVLKNV